MLVNSFTLFFSQSFSGVHFETELDKVLENFITLALKVFFKGVEAMIAENEINPLKLQYSLSCETVNPNYKWEAGSKFFE